jgi:secreted PhoX family phosphatase
MKSKGMNLKSNNIIKTTRRVVRGSLLCACLWLLAFHLTVAVKGQSIYANPYTFTTLAGLPESQGTNDGTGSAARFNQPSDLALDGAGNLYVADEGENTIRKVTPAGVVTTIAGQSGVAGTNDGMGSTAEFHSPWGVAVDTDGNVYVTDIYNDTIRKVTPVGTNWLVTTLAGQPGTAGTNDGTNGGAHFNQPVGLAVDTNGNLYVADDGNQTIRKVTPVGTNWVVTTLAGLAGYYDTNDGTNSDARFYYPAGVAVDTNGNLFVADNGSYTIRKVMPSGTNWIVTTIAGKPLNSGIQDGTNSGARFGGPSCVAVDTSGNLYVSDSSIREVTPEGTNWVVTTIAGEGRNYQAPDGTGSNATFNLPRGVAVDPNGKVYVADTYDQTIRKGFPAASVPPPVLQSPGLSAGQFGLGITGLPNLAVDIQSSVDLTNWEVAGSYYILVGGTNFFPGPSPPQGLQFYRVHVR